MSAKVDAMQQATHKATAAGSAVLGAGVSVSGWTNGLNLAAAIVGLIAVILSCALTGYLIRNARLRNKREELKIEELRRKHNEQEQDDE